MKSTRIELPKMHLVGITTRTNNIREMDGARARIGTHIGKYHREGIADKILHKSKPGRTICAYTRYDSDQNGDYTYFIGREVDSFEGQDEDLVMVTIPRQSYMKFTTKRGQMPDVCIDTWKKIWQMDASDFGGARTFIADFEVYDERAADISNTELDILIGVRQFDRVIGAVSLYPLLKAFNNLERFLIFNETEQEKAGTIQAFEYCYELAWKTMKRILSESGIVANSPREAFRASALQGWISDPEEWFEFLRMRNLTVHTYNKAEADQVFNSCGRFADALTGFLSKLK